MLLFWDFWKTCLHWCWWVQTQIWICFADSCRWTEREGEGGFGFVYLISPNFDFVVLKYLGVHIFWEAQQRYTLCRCTSNISRWAPGNHVGQGTVTVILSTTSSQTDINRCMFLCPFPWERENSEHKWSICGFSVVTWETSSLKSFLITSFLASYDRIQLFFFIYCKL